MEDNTTSGATTWVQGLLLPPQMLPLCLLRSRLPFPLQRKPQHRILVVTLLYFSRHRGGLAVFYSYYKWILTVCLQDFSVSFLKSIRVDALQLQCAQFYFSSVRLMTYGSFTNLGYCEQGYCNCYCTCLWVYVLSFSRVIPTSESARQQGQVQVQRTQGQASPVPAVEEIPHHSIPTNSHIPSVW